MAPELRAGIDFGGTKIEIIVLGPDGDSLLRRRVPNPGAYEAAVLAVVGLVTSAEAELGRQCSVGVGIPGAISPGTGLVRNANSVWLNGHGFDRDLGEALGRQVRVENDANCFALSEASDGAAAGMGVVFGVILGTGCGGGLVIGGRVLAGLHRIAFEFRHASWFTEETYAVLREHGCALCIAESDELQTPEIYTAPHIAYRLRRADYSRAEIAALAAKFGRLSAEHGIFCYFKHVEEPTGPLRAAMLRAMLTAGGTGDRIAIDSQKVKGGAA